MRASTRRDLGVWVAALPLLVGLGCGQTARAAASSAEAGEEAIVVHVAYTESVLRDIHDSDARAAIKVWSEAAAGGMDVRVHTEVEVLPDAEALLAHVSGGLVDFGGTTMREFLRIESRLDLDPLFVVTRGGKATEEYLLLVRSEGGPTAITDLRGATLIVYDNPRMSLAMAWLAWQFREAGVGEVERFLGTISRNTKLAQVALPVFFGNADACLLTRAGFEAMAELNPQLRRQLRVLAESPSVVPLISFFRREFQPPLRQEMVARICGLGGDSSGRQLLNLLQADGIMVPSAALLARTRTLLAEWESGKGGADRLAGLSRAALWPGNGATP